MTEFNKYEGFYITTAGIVQSLISETLSKRQVAGSGCCEKYDAGYLTALYRVEAAIRRQAYLFDIPSEEPVLNNVTCNEKGTSEGISLSGLKFSQQGNKPDMVEGGGIRIYYKKSGEYIV